jgi:DNA polymerase-3 subunit beta
MRFQIPRTRLLDAVSLVAAVIPSRSIKPVVQNLRLQADADGLTLLATDLDVAMRLRVPLEGVREGGDLLVSAAKLIGVLRESPAETVDLDADERALAIQAGRGSFRLVTLATEEFPTISVLPEERALKLPRDSFRGLMRKTAFAAARERGRYAFNGVRLEIEGESAIMAGTDGKKLAVKTIHLDEPLSLGAAPVISLKGIATMERVLDPGDPEVRVFVDDAQFIMRSGPAEVASRLVEGTFPRYETVVPRETPFRIRVRKLDLLNALRQAAVFTSEESQAVRFVMEDHCLCLQARSTDVGESKVSLDVETEGEPIACAFNPEYLIEGLRAMDAEQVTLRFSGKDTPACVDGEEDFIFVVMPVTLRSG